MPIVCSSPANDTQNRIISIQYTLSGNLKVLYIDKNNVRQETILTGGEGGGITLQEVKADTEIADSLTKRHSNSLDHSNYLDHAAHSDDQDLSGKANVTHSHSPSEITGTAVVTNDSRLSDARTPLTHTHSYEPSNSNIQTHISSQHAPSNAQKNSDITKEEIEAKLTGTITSHSHSGSGGLGYVINVQALTSSPADGATVYFGMLPKAPITTANVSKVYIRKVGTIKIAEIYCYSGTAGTNQAWSLYVRKNNTTDYLIATLSVATNERVFSNTAIDIPVSVGDYVEIKSVQPTWTTNPLTTIYGGYLYIE